MSVGRAYAAYHREQMTDKEKKLQEKLNRQRKLRTFNVSLVGNTFVGRKSLKIRFTCHNFGHDPYECCTLSYIEYSRDVQLDDTSWIVTSPYTSGGFYNDDWYFEQNDRFKALRLFGNFIPDGVLLVYDITDKASFTDMKDKFFPWITQYSKEWNHSFLPTIVAGTKCDLKDQREVSFETAKKFADEHNLIVIETSAKEDINVELAFMTLVAMMKERRENGTDLVKQTLGKSEDSRTKCSLQ